MFFDAVQIWDVLFVVYFVRARLQKYSNLSLSELWKHHKPRRITKGQNGGMDASGVLAWWRVKDRRHYIGLSATGGRICRMAWNGRLEKTWCWHHRMGAYKAYAPWWFLLAMATINQLKNTQLYSVGEITGSTWLKPIFERGSSKSETYQNISKHRPPHGWIQNISKPICDTIFGRDERLNINPSYLFMSTRGFSWVLTHHRGFGKGSGSLLDRPGWFESSAPRLSLLSKAKDAGIWLIHQMNTCV